MPHRPLLVDVGAGPRVDVDELHEHAEDVEDGGVDEGLERPERPRGHVHDRGGGDGDGHVHLLILQHRLARNRRPRPEQRQLVRLEHPRVDARDVAAKPRLEARLHDGLVRLLHRLELLGLGLVQELLAVERLLDRVRVRALLHAQDGPGVGGAARARARRAPSHRRPGASERMMTRREDASARREAGAERNRRGGHPTRGDGGGAALDSVRWTLFPSPRLSIKWATRAMFQSKSFDLKKGQKPLPHKAFPTSRSPFPRA